MKMQPVPVNATVQDLAERLTQLHECVEELKDGDVQTIKGDVGLIKRAMGLEHPSVDSRQTPPKPVAGLATQAQSFWRTVRASATSIFTLFLAYKFAVFMFPSVFAVLKALNAYALH